MHEAAMHAQCASPQQQELVCALIVQAEGELRAQPIVSCRGRMDASRKLPPLQVGRRQRGRAGAYAKCLRPIQQEPVCPSSRQAEGKEEGQEDVGCRGRTCR